MDKLDNRTTEPLGLTTYCCITNARSVLASTTQKLSKMQLIASAASVQTYGIREYCFPE